MKIDVVKLTNDKRIRLKQSCEVQSLDLEAPDIRFAGPIDVAVWAQKKNEIVIVEGQIFLSLILACSRCLKEYPSGLTRKITFNYPVGKSDFTIDLTDDLRSEIILGYPLNPLCRPDCRGLCLNCGEDLNEDKCKCQIKLQPRSFGVV